MDKKRSIFNKKKWIRNHLDEILRQKKQGLTHQAVIQYLNEQQNMPFELSESLFSRYLKDFAEDEATYKKVNHSLSQKVERQNERLTRQNNEIQNLNRRLERVLERDIDLDFDNQNLKERNRILENKFLEGEARLKDLRRYNGYGNLNWKIKDLAEKNDDLFQSVLQLEQLSERLAEPHEAANEKIEQLSAENEALQADLKRSQIETIQKRRETEFLIKRNDDLRLKVAAQVQTTDAVQRLQNENQQFKTQISTLEQQIEEYSAQNIHLTERNLHFKQQMGKAKEILDQQLETILKHEMSAKQQRFTHYGLILLCAFLLVLVIFI